MAALSSRGPLRFVGLLNSLGASRDTLTETLASLVETGLVERRAAEGERWLEYALTPGGEALAAYCVACMDAVRALHAGRVALKKWPMVVLVAVGRGQARYNALKSELPGITPRALAAALKDLEHDGFIARRIETGYPPGTRYRLTKSGEQLFPSMAALVDACERLAA